MFTISSTVFTLEVSNAPWTRLPRPVSAGVPIWGAPLPHFHGQLVIADVPETRGVDEVGQLDCADGCGVGLPRELSTHDAVHPNGDGSARREERLSLAGDRSPWTSPPDPPGSPESPVRV